MAARKPAVARPIVKPVATPQRLPFRHRLCRLVVRSFAALYLLALALVGISLVDPFGVVPRPLAGVFVLVLGLPWTLSAAWFPEDLQPLAAALAPAINWIILGFLCAWQRLKPRLPNDER